MSDCFRRESFLNSCDKFDSKTETCFRLTWFRLPEQTSRMSTRFESVFENLVVIREASDSSNKTQELNQIKKCYRNALHINACINTRFF